MTMDGDSSQSPFDIRPSTSPLAVVLLSGGMDSLTAAGLARRDGYDLALIHFNYGQRTEAAEARAFSRIADYLAVPAARRLTVHTNFFTLAGGSALTTSTISVPEADLGSEAIPITYVPFRNAVLLSMAVGWAEVLGARRVYYGAVSQDSSGYPDCRPSFIEAFNRLVTEGTKPGSGIEVRAPLVNLNKAQIVALALSLGLPLESTWSCYSRNDLACGTCDSCALRLRGFEQAGRKDPLRYAPKAMGAQERRERVRRLAVLLKALTQSA
jgi:7-cyano-7-deazaguanine synthase